MPLSITDVQATVTAPEGINLVVVKVMTSEPGLYGLGCATFTQQAHTVKYAIDHYLRDFLIGKDPNRIEDIWQTAMVSAYWRNGPVWNNAVAGVDMALWDIKAKLARMPVYELLGGRSRGGVAVYRHADGRDPQEVEENVRKFMEQGFRYVRCQMGGYGGALRLDEAMRITPRSIGIEPPSGSAPGAYFDPERYVRAIPGLFDYLRSKIGFDVELLHDVHERIQPVRAVRLAKELEPYKLFYLEDPVAPEDIEWLRMIRQQSATPIAIGELFVHPLEVRRVIAERLADFIRVHVSFVGGITPARKIAAIAEAWGVRTAWHGPGDLSPMGYAANVHLDLAIPNFGVQEWVGFSDRIREVFPGCPEIRDGYAYPSEGAGWGVDFDEKAAEKFPPVEGLPEWTLARLPDGGAARP